MTYFLTLKVVECCECGLPFGLTEGYQARRREDRQTFYCPSGHRQSYTGKTEADRLRDEVARERQRREQAEARAEHESASRASAERSLKAARGRITKLSKRVAAGACPCCGLGFPDLRAHMQAAHPEFTPDRMADVDAPLPIRPIEQAPSAEDRARMQSAQEQRQEQGQERRLGGRSVREERQARGAEIRAIRMAAGLSQAQLGERIGMGAAMVSHLEGGRMADAHYDRVLAALAAGAAAPA